MFENGFALNNLQRLICYKTRPTYWQINDCMEIWSDKITQEFFQAVAVSVLWYSGTTQTLMKHIEKKKTKWKLHKDAVCYFEKNPGSSTQRNNSCKAISPHLTNHPSKTNKSCWSPMRKNKLISNIPLWTPTHRHTSVDWIAKTYIHQLCVDTGRCVKYWPNVIANRDKWGEGVKVIKIQNSNHKIIFQMPVIYYALYLKKKKKSNS